MEFSDFKKFTLIGSKMKLAIFVFALIGAILASPQEARRQGERAAFPQDKPNPVVDRQGKVVCFSNETLVTYTVFLHARSRSMYCYCCPV